ncbi:hypothetical protein STH3083 [Symbiobacterium thermophilum IAM 14863]|uniref:Uncharacterized protein n=1 Tax=Symbiobacterium thermophilum (strain DSM 24528 / JCM 14929 / IAM 14863 / T) TaxID=292459 RepID=Q67JT5_SYMTH|nr:hypothetical protein STH3083 [Symbiobacterium thermophilum IAM 14863]
MVPKNGAEGKSARRRAPPAAEVDESPLIEAARAGVDGAFDSLVRPHLDRAYRITVPFENVREFAQRFVSR